MCADAKIRHLSINKRCRIQPLILLCALFLPDNILFLLSSVMSIIPQQETSENYNDYSSLPALSDIIPQQETSENYNLKAAGLNPILLYHNKKHQRTTTSAPSRAALEPLYHNKKHQRTTTLLLPHEGVADYTTTRNIRELQPYFLVPSTAAQAAIKNPRD